MSNLDIRIKENLNELNELLQINNPIDLPYLRRDGYLCDLRDIITSELNEDTFNFAVEVLHIIYKHKNTYIAEHQFWLDSFELFIRECLML